MRDIWKLRLHFAMLTYVSEIALLVSKLKVGEDVFKTTLTHLSVSAGLTVSFYYSLKLRDALAKLPDKDLDNFLVNTLFKGGVQTLFSILFLSFRTTKCMFKEEGFTNCLIFYFLYCDINVPSIMVGN